MYILYIVPGSGNLYILYRRKHTCAMFHGSDGDPKVPFYAALPGILLLTQAKNKSAWSHFRTQGPLRLNFSCIYLPMTICG